MIVRVTRDTGVWLVLGGLTILIVFQWLMATADAGAAYRSVPLGGAIVGYAAVGLGIIVLTNARGAGRGGATMAVPIGQSFRTSTTSGEEILQATFAAFDEWQDATRSAPQIWSAFDQFLREQITTHLGATRVRCFHIRPGETDLDPLSPGASPAALSARSGVLGYVATSGQALYPGSPNQGELLRKLIDGDTEKWQVVWPMRFRGDVSGLIAISELPNADHWDDAAGRLLFDLLQCIWSRVAGDVELRVAQTTDKATGVLTREDFFTAARGVCADAADQQEPVVACIVALEGLRGLDDAGHWSLRDSFVERVGWTLLQRVRQDDQVGRFSDDQFVLLLRRLDSGLAAVIARKLHVALVDLLSSNPVLQQSLTCRLSIVGSGFEPPDVTVLFRRAFENLATARTAGKTLVTDLDPQPAETEAAS